MRSNLDLLVTLMEEHQREAIALKRRAEEVARNAGEVKAIARAVWEEARTMGPEWTGKIKEQQCTNRFSHREHLWRDPDMHLVYRCGGRGTDAT